MVGTLLHRAVLSSAFGFAPEPLALNDNTADLYDFARVSTDVGWAVGDEGAVLRTTNAAEIGGLTWTLVSTGLDNPDRYVWRTVGYIPVNGFTLQLITTRLGFSCHLCIDTDCFARQSTRITVRTEELDGPAGLPGHKTSGSPVRMVLFYTAVTMALSGCNS